VAKVLQAGRPSCHPANIIKTYNFSVKTKTTTATLMTI